MTKLYAEVIGDPIIQSKSPAIHNYWLNELGIDAKYQAHHVTADGLETYLIHRRADPFWRGCNVTMPHKQAVLAFLDRLDPMARDIGAVNTVVREDDGSLVGYNTDVSGFLDPLKPFLAQQHLFRMARVLGTGGAARAVIVALARANIVLVVAGRNPDKARALLDELDPKGEHHIVPLEHFADETTFAFDDRAGIFDLIVNASPLGMDGQPPLAFDLSHAPPGSIFYDIVTHPADTPLLKAARAAGFPTIDGLHMLIGQAAAAFERFFGKAPLRTDQDAELRDILTR